MTLAAVALCAAAAPASAISLATGTGATLTPFQPGGTAVGTGSLSAVAVAAWTLKVQDSGVGAGKLRAAASGCTGSDVQLSNALTVSATVNGSTSARLTITGSPQTLATGAGLVSGFVITTNYSLVIPATQVLRTACAYSITLTYTLQ